MFSHETETEASEKKIPSKHWKATEKKKTVHTEHCVTDRRELYQHTYTVYTCVCCACAHKPKQFFFFIITFFRGSVREREQITKKKIIINT